MLCTGSGPSTTTWPSSTKVRLFFKYTFSIVHFMEMNNCGIISLFCLGGYLSGKEPVDFMQSAILSLCTQVSHISISISVNSRSMVAVML